MQAIKTLQAFHFSLSEAFLLSLPESRCTNQLSKSKQSAAMQAFPCRHASLIDRILQCSQRARNDSLDIPHNGDRRLCDLGRTLEAQKISLVAGVQDKSLHEYLGKDTKGAVQRFNFSLTECLGCARNTHLLY